MLNELQQIIVFGTCFNKGLVGIQSLLPKQNEVGENCMGNPTTNPTILYGLSYGYKHN